MGYRIEDIEGIGPAFATKLARVGVKNTDAFLKLCCDKKGRRQVSAQAEISEKHLLKWANLADLMRISGIGPQYSELLEAAGVDTVKELRNRNAQNLAAKMKQLQQEKRLTRTAPGVSTVSRWVAHPRHLPLIAPPREAELEARLPGPAPPCRSSSEDSATSESSDDPT